MIDTDDGFVTLLAARVRAGRARVFGYFNGQPITFAALDRMSEALAANLRRAGVSRNDRVAVMLRNSPQALATLFGLAKAGAVWVPVNAQQRGEGLRYILEHSSPRLVIAEREFVPTIEDSGADLRSAAIFVLGDEAAPRRLETLLAGEASLDEPPAEADDSFAIMYTSGTTGPPKGVVVTHRMLRLAAEAVALTSSAKPGDVLFVWEPIYHIGGAQVMVVPLIRDVVLAMVDRFSASRFWHQVRESRATQIHYLGGILQILLKQPPSPLDRSHCVRVAWGGGCPKEIWRAFQDRFGIEIRESYGLTEASSFTTYNDRGVVGSIGRPVPWFTVELRDREGKPVAPGERGEIVVRTSQPGALFAGYFRDPEASARALRDGALHTGDLGSSDAAGNLFFHGRVTDSVRCRGENVSAWEVERIAANHPAVEECAMIGVAAEVGEQDIKLFVKPKSGASIGAAALSAWLGQRLAPYQNPRYIAVIDDFERTPSQRIMKHKLPTDIAGCFDREAR